MLELNQKILVETNEVFKRLNKLRRWTSFVTENKYNELAKQALNCITAYFLASYCENAGQKINWEMFPKIALFRAFQKGYVYFDTPEYIIEDMCEIGNIQKTQFNRVTEEIIAEKTNEKFMLFLSQDIYTNEYQIYRAATKIATYVELLENYSKIKEFEEYNFKLQQISISLREFLDIPGMKEFLDTDSAIFKVLQKISKLRNQNRWSANIYSMECSVLGHLFDTALFAYYISLEKFPRDEKMAAKFFFMGIFHDLAETWTTDFQSSIKDRIPNFRQVTEEYEKIVLDRNLYNKVPEFLAKKLKDVMFEDEKNLKFKKLIKGADYLSGDSECWRQYKAGTRDEYFLGAMQKFDKDLAKGERVELTPLCKELHDYLMAYAEKLDL